MQANVTRRLAGKMVKHCGRELHELVSIEAARQRGWYTLRFGDGDVQYVNKKWVKA